MKKNTTFIYTLIDPITNEVRYVGKSDNPWYRLYKGNKIHIAHLKDNSNTHKVKWLNNLKNNNLVPILQILEECNKSEWQKREIEWINFYKSIGSKLTNSTDGGKGAGGFKFSEESKQKISLKNKGKKRSKETCEKISKSLTGFKMTEEQKNKMSIAAKKRWKNDVEFRKMMSEVHKNFVFSEETKKKISDSKKGKPPNNKGKKRSEESIRKFKETCKKNAILKKGKHGNLGKKHSIVTKEKMSKKRKGLIPWNKGLKTPESVKKKISDGVNKNIKNKKEKL